MIDVKVCRKADGSVTLEMEGHAGAASKGWDLICCAATQCAYTAAQAVTFYRGQGFLQEEPRIELGEGRAVVTAKAREEYEAEVLNSFWTVQCGLHVLCQNYPRYIRLTERL